VSGDYNGHRLLSSILRGVINLRKPKLNIERLKELRELKGWSKNYAAEEMGLAQSAYLRYESGETAPSYSVIKNMALTLGTSIEYLTGKLNDKSPNELIISCSDNRLSYIIETYHSLSDTDKEHLFEYTKKLSRKNK
jgi:transcriptional regulator with XRE-family HTH domain